MARKTISDDFEVYRKGLFVVDTNPWNKGDLVNGQDFTQSITYNPADLSRDVQIDWAWPHPGQSDWSVLAYPEVRAGFSAWSQTGSKAMVTQVKDLRSLTIDYDLSIRGDTPFFNVAFEFWLTRKANPTAPEITTEVMVWLHNGKLAPEEESGIRYANGGYKADIWMHDNWGDDSGGASNTWRFVTLTPDQDQLAGQIDLHDVMVALQRKGMISGDDFFTGYELGAEVTGGTGQLSIHSLDQTLTRYGASDGNDLLFGTAARDQISGGSGNDHLFGGTGGDWLMGEAGRDHLRGGAGRDLLMGGTGRDIMTGGSGNDRFVFETLADSGATRQKADILRGFSADHDQIILKSIDADSTRFGNQTFTWIGGAEFGEHAGELRISDLHHGQDRLIEADVNGDGRADFALLLRGAVDLAEQNFML